MENAACESLEVVPGGLVLELNIDRARVTDTLKFRLRSRTHVECTQLGLPSRALTNVPKQQAPELHQAVAHPGSVSLARECPSQGPLLRQQPCPPPPGCHCGRFSVPGGRPCCR